MVVCDTVLPLTAALPPAAALPLVPAAGVLFAPLELLPELPQADTASARAASPAAPHIDRISVSPLHSAMISR
jgi:hypothetical protein